VEVVEDLYHDPERYEAYRREAVELAKSSGIEAGSMVFHLYRLTDQARHEFGKEAWKEVAERGLLTDPDYASFGPHWHICGFGYSEQGDLFYERTAWILTRIGTVQPQRVHNLLRYELGHASWYESEEGKRTHCITSFGDLSSRKLAVEREKSVYVAGCVDCGCRVEAFNGWVETGGNIDMTNAQRMPIHPLRLYNHRSRFSYRHNPKVFSSLERCRHREAEWIKGLERIPSWVAQVKYREGPDYGSVEPVDLDLPGFDPYDFHNQISGTGGR